MARVTVEDCIEKIPNRFDLVMLSSQRARQISAGEEILVERDNDKNPVVALREIADEKVSVDELSEAVITGFQKHVEIDEPEEDDMAALMSAQDWASGEADAVEAARSREAAANIEISDGDGGTDGASGA